MGLHSPSSLQSLSSLDADTVGCYWQAWSTGAGLWTVNTASVCTSWLHVRVATRLNSSAWSHLLICSRTCYSIVCFGVEFCQFGSYCRDLVANDVSANDVRKKGC